MKKKPSLKLTKLQQSILEELRDGALITVDHENSSYLRDRIIQPQTRYFLTENRFITRLDKSKAVTTKGNGFTISEKGLNCLENVPPLTKDTKSTKLVGDLKDTPPTDRQLSYAQDFGINAPQGATAHEISDLITNHTEQEEIASSSLQTCAKVFNVKHTQFTGRKTLFRTIFNALTLPGHDRELALWFAYRVYRDLSKNKNANAPISIEDQKFNLIADQLVKDETVLTSIRRYDACDLIWFGEWTAKTGEVFTGGSKNTKSYKKTIDILKEHFGSTNPIFRATRASTNRGPYKQIHQDKNGCMPSIVFSFITVICITYLLVKF